MLAQTVKEILVGSILGDGHITRYSGRSKTSSVCIKYDARYLDYTKWLHRKLKSLKPSPIKKKNGYHQYQFRTQSREDIGELRRIFYPRGIKKVPGDIDQYLEPISLAVWYQDDGTLDNRRKYHANSLFATHCFSKRQCNILVSALWRKFGIDARVCRCLMRGKLRYRLYVVSESMHKLMYYIEPYVQKCFRYKLI